MSAPFATTLHSDESLANNSSHPLPNQEAQRSRDGLISRDHADNSSEEPTSAQNAELSVDTTHPHGSRQTEEQQHDQSRDGSGHGATRSSSSHGPQLTDTVIENEGCVNQNGANEHNHDRNTSHPANTPRMEDVETSPQMEEDGAGEEGEDEVIAREELQEAFRQYHTFYPHLQLAFAFRNRSTAAAIAGSSQPAVLSSTTPTRQDRPHDSDTQSQRQASRQYTTAPRLAPTPLRPLSYPITDEHLPEIRPVTANRASALPSPFYSSEQPPPQARHAPSPRAQLQPYQQVDSRTQTGQRVVPALPSSASSSAIRPGLGNPNPSPFSVTPMRFDRLRQLSNDRAAIPPTSAAVAREEPRTSVCDATTQMARGTGVGDDDDADEDERPFAPVPNDAVAAALGIRRQAAKLHSPRIQPAPQHDLPRHIPSPAHSTRNPNKISQDGQQLAYSAPSPRMQPQQPQSSSQTMFSSDMGKSGKMLFSRPLLGLASSSPLALRYEARVARPQMQQPPMSPARMRAALFTSDTRQVSLTQPAFFTNPPTNSPLFPQVPSSPSDRQHRRANLTSVASPSSNFTAEAGRLNAGLSQGFGPTLVARADGGSGVGFGAGGFGLGIVEASSPWDGVDRQAAESQRIQPQLHQQQAALQLRQRDYAPSHSSPHLSSHRALRYDNRLVLPGPSRKRSISAPDPPAHPSLQQTNLLASPASSTTTATASAVKVESGRRIDNVGGPASEPAPSSKKRARNFKTEEQREKRREQNRIAQANHKARRMAHVTSLEERVEEQAAALVSIRDENDGLQQLVRRLGRDNERLRVRLGRWEAPSALTLFGSDSTAATAHESDPRLGGDLGSTVHGHAFSGSATPPDAGRSGGGTMDPDAELDINVLPGAGVGSQQQTHPRPASTSHDSAQWDDSRLDTPTFAPREPRRQRPTFDYSDDEEDEQAGGHGGQGETEGDSRFRQMDQDRSRETSA